MCSTDGDFARFPDLTWLKPLAKLTRPVNAGRRPIASQQTDRLNVVFGEAASRVYKSIFIRIFIAGARRSLLCNAAAARRCILVSPSGWQQARQGQAHLRDRLDGASGGRDGPETRPSAHSISGIRASCGGIRLLPAGRTSPAGCACACPCCAPSAGCACPAACDGHPMSPTGTVRIPRWRRGRIYSVRERRGRPPSRSARVGDRRLKSLTEAVLGLHEWHHIVPATCGNGLAYSSTKPWPHNSVVHAAFVAGVVQRTTDTMPS
jgi:hypothetical protein